MFWNLALPKDDSEPYNSYLFCTLLLYSLTQLHFSFLRQNFVFYCRFHQTSKTM
jgi:hypothetical protein